MDKLMLINLLKNSKEQLADKYGISQLGLFGSYATGQQNSESDIDLIYHLKPGSKIKLAQRVELENYLTELLQNQKIDLVNGKYINPIIEFDMKKTVVYV